jgi:GST-like protein
MNAKPLIVGQKGWGNAIAEAAFALAGVDYDLEHVEFGDGMVPPPQLLERNPLGQVPTLILPNGEIVSESVAIVHYADERAPQAGLIPKPGDPLRARFYRWQIFLVAAIYPTFTYGDEPRRFVPDETGAKQLRESTDRLRERQWRMMEAQAHAPWFLGERRSAIDLYLGIMTRWRPRRDWFKANAPRIAAIAERVDALPELREVLKRNFG